MNKNKDTSKNKFIFTTQFKNKITGEIVEIDGMDSKLFNKYMSDKDYCLLLN